MFELFMLYMNVKIKCENSFIIPPALGAGDPIMVERVNVNIAPLPVFTAPSERVIINSSHPELLTG